MDRYDTFDAVRDYCRRSADPVGRLVLYTCGYRDDARQQLSDCTCTALQLANFWQDVRRDILDRDRVYLPRETMDRFGVTERQLRDGGRDRRVPGRRSASSATGRPACWTGARALLPLLDDAVRPQVSLFGQGGRAILAAIRRQGYDTLTRRPTVSKWSKGQLVLRAVAGRLRQMMTATTTCPAGPAWRRAGHERAGHPLRPGRRRRPGPQPGLLPAADQGPGEELLLRPEAPARAQAVGHVRPVRLDAAGGRHRRRRLGRPHRPPAGRTSWSGGGPRPTASSTAAPTTATGPAGTSAATCGRPSPRWSATTACPGTCSTT